MAARSVDGDWLVFALLEAAEVVHFWLAEIFSCVVTRAI